MAMTDALVVTTASSDADLISAVRSGDADAYGILYQRHADSARRLARQISQRAADIDDVVAETFSRVLATIRRGAGPSAAFRPYLLTAVRRVAVDHVRGQRSQVPTDDAALPDPGEPFTDPAEASLERSIVARAFFSLPDRWSAVLWHTEIEQARPAEVALLLGISPNSVAALRYRAREGLRQAYLQMHLSDRARDECLPFAGKLGGYVRGALSRRDARQVSAHLRKCADCRSAHAEVSCVNDTIRGLLAPAVLGGHAAAYLAHGGSYAATAAAGFRVGLRWLRTLLVHRPVLPVAAGVAMAAVAVPTATLVYPHLPRTPTRLGAGPGGTSGPVARAGRRGTAQPHAPGGTGRAGPPAGSPTPSPTASARPSPTATATPSPTAPLTIGANAAAKLGVSVTVNGLLNLGVTDTVAVRVSDQGTAATGGITASLALPAGITLLGLGADSSGWSCSGSTCTHGPVAAGATATVSFRILVASLESCGAPVAASAVSGTLSATGQSAATVGCRLL